MGLGSWILPLHPSHPSHGMTPFAPCNLHPGCHSLPLLPIYNLQPPTSRDSSSRLHARKTIQHIREKLNYIAVESPIAPARLLLSIPRLSSEDQTGLIVCSSPSLGTQRNPTSLPTPVKFTLDVVHYQTARRPCFLLLLLFTYLFFGSFSLFILLLRYPA
jgi:hypothetical protein